MATTDLVKTEIRGDHKVEVFRDDANDSPAQAWDLVAAFYAGQHWDNTEDDLGSGVRSAGDALQSLMDKYVSVDGMVEAIKAGKFADLTLREGKIIGGKSHELVDADCLECPSDLYNWMYGQEVVDLINENADIVAKLHDFENYSECISCVCATTKERYEKMCCKAEDGWKKDASEQIDADIATMDKWFCGEVYGFKEYALVKKHVTLEWPAWADEYGDQPKTEDVEEWEEIDALWDIYDEPDEIIEGVFSGNY